MDEQLSVVLMFVHSLIFYCYLFAMNVEKRVHWPKQQARMSCEKKMRKREYKSNWITSTMEIKCDESAHNADCRRCRQTASHWFLSSSSAFPQNGFICVSILSIILLLLLFDWLQLPHNWSLKEEEEEEACKILNSFSCFCQCHWPQFRCQIFNRSFTCIHDAIHRR